MLVARVRGDKRTRPGGRHEGVKSFGEETVRCSWRSAAAVTHGFPRAGHLPVMSSSTRRSLAGSWLWRAARLVGCAAAACAGNASPASPPSAQGAGGAPAAGGTGGADAGAAAGTGGSSAAGTGGGGVATGGAGAGGSDAAGAAGHAACTPLRLPADSSQPPGTWRNVTPPAFAIGDGNGAGSAVVDPARPSDIYVGTDHRGTFRSTDYGLTWAKANTGRNADKVEAGAQWSMAIDPDPCRDPATPPALYTVVLFGAGAWKSTDRGENWSSIWDHNVHLPDGSDIFADVGSDVGAVLTPDPRDGRHLLAIMHSYFGQQGNSGIYESRDAGATWTLHKSTLFTFQAHNDVFGVLDATTWLVSPGTISQRLNIFRTADSGATWTDLGEAPARALGYIMAGDRSVVYTGTDYNSGVWRSNDRGVSWQNARAPIGQVSWVVASAKKVYASGGWPDPVRPRIASTTIGHDESWVTEMAPVEMTANGHRAAITFDGTHYIIIAPQHKAGIWRYVEP